MGESEEYSTSNEVMEDESQIEKGIAWLRSPWCGLCKCEDIAHVSSEYSLPEGCETFLCEGCGYIWHESHHGLVWSVGLNRWVKLGVESRA